MLIGAAQFALCAGVIDDGLREDLRVLQHDLIGLLAKFEDGPGFGRASPDILDHLRILEQIASDLIEASDAEPKNIERQRNRGH